MKIEASWNNFAKFTETHQDELSDENLNQIIEISLRGFVASS